MASISNEVIEETEELDHDFTGALRLVQVMHENGEFDQVELFVKARQYAATVTALATLCSAPIDMIKQMLNDGRNEPLLVPCKAAGILWPTLRALLQDDLLGRPVLEDELKKLKSDYTKRRLQLPKNCLSSGVNTRRRKNHKWPLGARSPVFKNIV